MRIGREEEPFARFSIASTACNYQLSTLAAPRIADAQLSAGPGCTSRRNESIGFTSPS